MNTPAHAVINLLILSRDPSQRKTAAIVTGALIPDLVIILFYAWQLMLGTRESQIWSVEYHAPLWQAWIDSFNSIPLCLAAMLICWKLRQPLLMAFFASMLLHTFGDLPLHHDDGHRHFFPFSDWRFASPVSYWDPAHHGQWASLLEFVAVIAASIVLFRRDPIFKPWIYAGIGVYFSYWIYVFLVWA